MLRYVMSPYVMLRSVVFSYD